ncbi:hypothetical protein [Cyclobacterium jeungdonense]|uniref:Uncharacterized protein n=1 Tax=Cyclobacterium jeungdonense TaxID=708087 RepID=A0ABT8CD06_9BACT|nr:hypothetical protein [Cyclobacterium jeungdonense]MDN3690683.1 hypothetical protein [Cyclobacterium jeungdonense]
MKTKKNQDSQSENFEDNSFDEAQEEASDGKGPKSADSTKTKKSEKKAKDELMRAKEADKEWSSESDRFRRDNA